MPDYAIKVVQKNGAEDFLCDGLGDRPTRFPSYAAAYRQVDFMKIGMEGDVQSINIVKYPKKFRPRKVGRNNND
jgi:hypothetical protein